MASMRRSAVPAVMRKRAAQRREFFHSAPKITAGIRATKGLSYGTFSTRALVRANPFVSFPSPTGPNSTSGHYIALENIPVVPLYFAEERPVVRRNGTWIMVDDERLPLDPGEQPQMRRVRFRTLGCYPLSGAIKSDATTLAEIVAEVETAAVSERQGRLIDSDEAASMEKKKREGYF